MELTRQIFEGRTTFILGSEKHAGKTTLLNLLISLIRRGGDNPAYLTIGVDGEGKDLLTGRPKPYIRAEAGDWLVTTEAALRRSTALIERHEVFPFRTVLGPLVLGKILRGGTIELVGPETNAQLTVLLGALADIAGNRPVVIDGAVNRVTQVAAAPGSSFLYVETVRPANLTRAVAEIERIVLLSQVPQIDDDPMSPDDDTVVVIDGALTERKVQDLPPQCQTLVVEDFSKVMVGLPALRGVMARRTLRFRHLHTLAGVVVNLRDVSQRDFIGSLSSPTVESTIAFNPYRDSGGSRAHAPA